MTVRTPTRPGLPVGLRAERGSNALIARYVRELSTRDTVRRQARTPNPNPNPNPAAARAVPQEA
jgi:hypothetical protein